MSAKKLGKVGRETSRIGRFGLVGLFNTVLDFSLLNILVRLALPDVVANIISTGTAMIFSFLLNRRWVFKSGEKNLVRQTILFVIVTIIGLWGLQSLVIAGADVWTAPTDLAVNISHLLRLDAIFSDDFVRLNFKKGIATGVSLVWNYVLYRKVVFAK